MYDSDMVCLAYATQQNWSPPSWELDIYNGDNHR